MEVTKLVVESELHPLAYATATGTPDLSSVCDLHHSSQQHQILNPLSKARNRTCILMDASRVLNPLSHNGNSPTLLYTEVLHRIARGGERGWFCCRDEG